MNKITNNPGKPCDQSQSRPRQLPAFDGYTVDIRMREFRKAEYGKALEFIPFDSPRGKQILERMKGK